MMELEVEQLRSGTWIARPKGTLGNVGWSPFAWTACYANSASKARAKFLSMHRNKVA